MALGRTVDRMRSQGDFVKGRPEREEQLEELGWVSSELDYRWEQKVLPSLRMYSQLHGHLRVPRDFTVPSEAPWPEEAWGMALGVTVNNMRSGGNFVKGRPEREEQLEKLGWVSSVTNV